MRLVTGAVIPAFNNPFKLAGELAMLDNISRGRLDAGFARAFIPAEFDAFGVAMDESRARFEEGIEVIKRLWTEDRVTHHGRFVDLDDIHAMPRVYQKPHPPIWIAATTTPESFEWAGRQGYNVMMVPFAGSLERAGELARLYRTAWRESGRPAGQEQIQVSIHTYLADTHAKAVEGFVKPFARFLEVFVEAVESWSGRTTESYTGYDRLVHGVRSMTPEKLLDGKLALVGTPEEVVDQLRSMVDLFGGEFEPSLQPNFANISQPEALQTLRMFAEDVMPHFAPASTSAAR
jgi:alkanesulfonate monooxygenase SsuD/methylene tetrahydromethanopterin reductase-like flavin-dependent oxidoreductase (luciferase family)